MSTAAQVRTILLKYPVKFPFLPELGKRLITNKNRLLNMFRAGGIGGAGGLVTVVVKYPEEAVKTVVKYIPDSWKEYFAWLAFEELKPFIIQFFIMGSFGAIVGGITIKRWWQHLAREVPENVPGRILMVLADDVLEHQGSRRALYKLLVHEDFKAVIPLCVIESLWARMQTVGLDSLKAKATFLTITRLVKNGQAKVQFTLGDGAGTDHPFGRMFQDRVLNTCCVLSHCHPSATVFLVSSSDGLRAKASRRAVRSATTRMLSKLRGL